METPKPLKRCKCGITYVGKCCPGCGDENEITTDEMIEDLKIGTLERMDRAYKELVPILREIMFVKIKYSEAIKFIQSGNLKKSLKHIKTIVEAHQYLKERGL